MCNLSVEKFILSSIHASSTVPFLCQALSINGKQDWPDPQPQCRFRSIRANGFFLKKLNKIITTCVEYCEEKRQKDNSGRPVCELKDEK